MTDGRNEAVERARRRLLGEVRAALEQARARMRELRGEGGADGAELDRLARRTDLMLAELEALGDPSSVPDEIGRAQSSSSSSSSSGSSVA